MQIKVVCQTTYIQENLDKCIDILKLHSLNYKLFDTICNETKKRQNEAYTMSKTKDLMVVIGDKNSSNSNKLFNICKNNCPSIFIENSKDLENYNYDTFKNIGVIAGASTPSNTITEVISTLKNLIKQ